MMYWFWETIDDPEQVGDDDTGRYDEESIYADVFRQDTSDSRTDEKCRTKSSSHHTHIFRLLCWRRYI